MIAKAASRSLSVLAVSTSRRWLRASAPAWMSGTSARTFALREFPSTAIALTSGRSSCSNSTRFGPPTLAWISTGPDLPNMVLGQTAHFRALSLRNYYAKWCADSPIAQRLLAQRSRDSGQFRSLLDEEMLGAGLHQRTNWPTSYSKILESRESVSVSDVREFSFRGNPG